MASSPTPPEDNFPNSSAGYRRQSISASGGTGFVGLLHDFVGRPGHATRCGRERIPTGIESAIRARFVRDSFHSLSTELATGLSYGGMVRKASAWGAGRRAGWWANSSP